jgi:ABC-type sugar transport system substrate-binding protein
MRITRSTVIGIVAVLALVAAGAAFAVSRSSDERCADKHGLHHQHRGAPYMAVRASFAAAAEYLGISRRELVGRLRDGQSLAQVAEAEGKSVEGLKQAIRAAIDARLDSVIDDLVQRARAPRD